MLNANDKRIYRIKRTITLRRWALSYIMILLIPLICAIASCIFSRHIIIKETSRANRTMLLNTVKEIDNTANHMTASIESIIVNKQFTNFLSLKSGRIEYIYLLPDVVSMLSSQPFSITGIDSLIYIPEIDYLIARSTANTTMNIYNSVKYKKKTNLSYESYHSLFQSSSSDYKWFVSDSYSYSNAGLDSVVLFRSFYASEYPFASKFSANIYASVPLSKFTEMFDDPDAQNCLLIFDETGLMIHYGAQREHFSSIDLKSVSNEINTLEVGGETYIASGAKSATSGWTFVLLVPAANYWSSTYEWTLFASTIILIAFIVGLILISLLIKFNYTPLYNMLKALGITIDQTLPANEYDLIQNTYLKVYSDYQKTNKSLMKQRAFIQRNYILSHLQGHRQYFSSEDHQEYLQLDMENKDFSIISFVIIDDETSSDDETDEIVINTICDTLLGKGYRSYHFIAGRIVTFLMILETNQTADFTENIDKGLNKLLADIKKRFNMNVSVIISNVCDSFNKLPHCYQDNLNAVEYQCIVKKAGIMYASELKTQLQIDRIIQQDVEIAELLCDAIRTHNYADSESVLERLFDLLITSDKILFSKHRLRVLSWLNIISNAFYSEWFNDGNSDQLKQFSNKLIECDNIIVMKVCFREIVCFLCGDDTGIDQRKTKLSKTNRDIRSEAG